MRTLAWFPCSVLVLVLTACSGEDLSSPAGGAGSAGLGGAGGGSGASGSSGTGGVSGGSGQGGAAGSSAEGPGGAAGTSAGQGGGAGSDAGAAGSGGSAGGGAGGGASGAGAGGAGGVSGGSGQGGTSGAAGQGGGASGTAGAGGSSPLEDCGALHVSPFGDDSQSGCSKAPLRTIGKALSKVTEQKKLVRVCEGEFDEPLSINSNVTIEGSHDCTTWASQLPGEDTFKEATAGGQITTRIVNSTSMFTAGNLDERSRTVIVRTGREVTLRGLIIRGHTSVGASSWAVEVKPQNASLTLDRCQLEGGKGQNKVTKGWGSIGLEVGAQSATHIQYSALLGGGGTVGAGVGSNALLVNKNAGSTNDPVSLHRAYVDGGNGVADGDEPSKNPAQGSVGLLSFAGVKVSQSVLRGGKGTVFYGLPSVGLEVTATDFAQDTLVPVNVADSELDAGLGYLRTKNLSEVSAGGSYGALLQHASGTITRSRVYGGDPYQLTPSAKGQSPDAVGVGVSFSSIVTLSNNLIVGGNLAPAAGQSAGHTRGVSVFLGAQASLLHNTVLAGKARVEFTNSVALFVNDSATIGRFENNLLGTSDSSASPNLTYNIYLVGCPVDRFKSFSGNALMPAVVPLMAYYTDGTSACMASPPTGAFTTFSSLDKAQVVLTSSKITNNRLVAASCANDAECIPIAACSTGSLCQQFLFDKDKDIDLAQLEPNFPFLSTALPCALARQSNQLTDVLVDAFETGRQNKTTPGALQQLNCIQ